MALYNTEQLQQLLDSIANEKQVTIPTPLFLQLAHVLDENLIDSLVQVCIENQARYLPELTTPDYYDVTYRTPAGNMGTHVAMQANSVADAVTRTPIMLSFSTQWHPSEFTVLSIIPTPVENRPVLI